VPPITPFFDPKGGPTTPLPRPTVLFFREVVSRKGAKGGGGTPDPLGSGRGGPTTPPSSYLRSRKTLLDHFRGRVQILPSGP